MRDNLSTIEELDMTNILDVDPIIKSASKLWVRDRRTKYAKGSLILLLLYDGELEQGGNKFWAVFREMYVVTRFPERDNINSCYLFLEGSIENERFNITSEKSFNEVNVNTDIVYPSWATKTLSS